MSVWGTIYNNTRAALSTHMTTMAQLQEQVASGARINRISDDPSDAHRILQLRAQSESLGRYGENIEEVSRRLELGYNVLQEMSDSLRSALESLEQSVSATYNQDTRTILGQSFNETVEQMLSLVGTNSIGQYLFSGADTQTQPYDTETDGEYITAVTYQGSLDDLSTSVAPGVEVPAALVAETLFRVDDRQEPEFLGETGVQAGSGTSSIRGDLYLDVTHKETNVVSDPDGVNLQISADPSGYDTILGIHSLEVDVTQNTIRFVDGPLTTFSGTETSLAVANADGDVVYVDVTALNASLPGSATVEIQSDGYLSLGDGAAATELTDFAATNLAVFDDDGRVLYVDATGIERTGLAPVQVPGTHDLFGTLIHTGQVLRNDRGLTDAAQKDLLANATEAVRQVILSVTRGMTSIGARLESLDSLGTNLENIQASADDQANALENADLTQVATDLARAQTLYEMTLASTAKLLSLSLLDYI